MNRIPILLLLACVFSSGCTMPDTALEKAHTYEATGLVLFAGPIYDHRAKPERNEDGELTAAERGEIRIPSTELRSVLAESLATSGLFKRVVNPPAEFAGTKPDDMLANAQQSSDYLLVGEINQFHVKSLGFNYLASFSLPLDLLMFPVSLVVYAMSAGNHMAWTGGFMKCWTAEAVLSVSVSLIDATTGGTVLTVRLEEHAQLAHDGRDAFGVLWEETDDWLDLGRRLGEIAVHNAGVHLNDKLANELPRLRSPRPAAPAPGR